MKLWTDEKRLGAAAGLLLTLAYNHSPSDVYPSLFLLAQYSHPFASHFLCSGAFYLQFPRAHWLQRKNENFFFFFALKNIYCTVTVHWLESSKRNEENKVQHLVQKWVFWEWEKVRRSGDGTGVRFMDRFDEAKKWKGCAKLMASRHVFEAIPALDVDTDGYITFTLPTALHCRVSACMCVFVWIDEWKLSTARSKQREKQKKCSSHLAVGIWRQPKRVIYCRQFPGVRCAPFFLSLPPSIARLFEARAKIYSKFIEPIEWTASN